MPPNVRKRGVWVGCGGPDEFLPAPDQKAVPGAGQGVVAPAEAELTAVGVEVVDLRVPSTLTEPLAVLAFKEGFHVHLVFTIGSRCGSSMISTSAQFDHAAASRNPPPSH